MRNNRIIKDISKEYNVSISDILTYNNKLNENVNVFYGNNAQGKTNIIESIFLCSMKDAHLPNSPKREVNPRFQSGSFYHFSSKRLPAR